MFAAGFAAGKMLVSISWTRGASGLPLVSAVWLTATEQADPFGAVYAIAACVAVVPSTRTFDCAMHQPTVQRSSPSALTGLSPGS
jgi:hypothetical protein